MLQLHNLRVQLQQRRNRVHKASVQQYETELRLFFEFLALSSHLSALIKTLECNKSVDFAQWKQEIERRFVSFPSSEITRAKLCYCILKECADDPEERQAVDWAQRFSNETNIAEMLNDLNETVLDALWHYLDDRIDEAGDVLYLLERFKLKSEWFRQDDLWHLYNDDTASGEANLDRVLREALFDGGIDFPFSQPDSPSGKADIVVLGGTQDPLVLEVKVFDPDLSKGKGHLRQGFHQVLRYANDYQQAVGYLVIFNCSNNHLVLPSEDSEEGEFPPRVVHDGKTFFIVAVDISSDRDSASREDARKRVEITRAELVG